MVVRLLAANCSPSELRYRLRRSTIDDRATDDAMRPLQTASGFGIIILTSLARNSSLQDFSGVGEVQGEDERRVTSRLATRRSRRAISRSRTHSRRY